MPVPDPAPRSADPLRVLVVDADDRVRESLTGLLAIGGRLSVVGGAGLPGPALDLAIATHPDVVIVDPRLPDVDAGTAFIGRLRELVPDTRVLAMSLVREPGARRHRLRCRRLRPQDLPPRGAHRRHHVRRSGRLTGLPPDRLSETPALLDSTATRAPSDPVLPDQAPGADVTDTETAPIRVLIVDDHSVVRMGLRMFFDLQDDIEVVGEAADGSEGVAMARRLEPDVVLMDLLMPNMDGITAIGRIKAERPETEIVTMTSFIEEEKVTSALEAGASGYVLKDAEAEEVAAAVRAAYAGEVHLDPAVARLLAQRLRTRKSPEDELAEPLTDREKDVIRLLGQGMSNKEIGAALFITERTARTYVSNILGKLGLASRTQAALYAVEHKLV